MQAADVLAREPGQRRSSRARSRPRCSDDAELWRGQMLDQLFDYSNELGELLLAEADVPEELIRRAIRAATIHNSDRAGAVRLGLGSHRRAAGAGRDRPLPAQPGRSCRRSKGPTRQSPTKSCSASRPRRAVLRPGLQDPGRQARRPALHADLFRRVESQQPRAQSAARTRRKTSASSGTSRPTARAGRPGRGGRHHRHHRPAALGHRRHAVRPEGPDPAGIDRLSRDGDLDGDRAGKLGRAQEAGRRRSKCSSGRIPRSAARRARRPARR